MKSSEQTNLLSFSKKKAGTVISSEFHSNSTTTFLENVSAINLSASLVAKYPNVINRGALTLAAPSKEEKSFRRISDVIGNNYSPKAKNLNSKLIYDATKFDMSLEEQFITSPLLSTPIVSHTPFNFQTPTNTLRLKTITNTTPAFKNSSTCLSHYNTMNVNANSVKTNKAHTVLSIDQSVLLFKNTIMSNTGGGAGGEVRGGLFTIDTDIKKFGQLKLTFRKRELVLTPDRRLCDDEVNKILNKSDFKAIKETSDEQQQQQDESYNKQQDHDKTTKTVLGITFQPYYISTHGLSRPNSPANDESNWQRYDNLLNGINEQMISDLPVEWMSNIENLVGIPKLSSTLDCNQFLAKFYVDLNENYCRSIKKAIIDYLLLDVDEQKRLGIKIRNKVSLSAGRYSYPWHDRFINTKAYLSTNLYTIHPSLQKINTEFFQKYNGFRLIDFDRLKAAIPMNLDDYITFIRHETDAKANHLNSIWVNDCAQIIQAYQIQIETLMPDETSSGLIRMRKMDHFFGTVSALMSRMIRLIVESTIHDYIEFIEQYKKGNDYTGQIYNIHKHDLALPYLPMPIRINMHAIKQQRNYSFGSSDDLKRKQMIENDKLVIILPDVQTELANGLSSTIDIIVNSLDRISRVEFCNLFRLPTGLTPNYLSNVKTHEIYVEQAKLRLSKVIVANSLGPNLYKKTYNHFNQLLTNAYDEEIEKFTKNDKSLAEYSQKIDTLKSIRNEVYSLPVSVPMFFFLVDCTSINTWLIDETKKLTEKLVDRIKLNCKKCNRSICDSYDDIYKSILNRDEPSPDSCIDLMKFVDNAIHTDCVELLEKTRSATENILFLIDNSILTPDDIKLNTNTINWHDRIQPILKDTEAKLLKEKDYWLLKLRDRKNKLVGLLNECSIKIKEFKQKDRVAEADAYVQELDQMTTSIQEFNSEKSTINHQETILNTGMYTEFSAIQEITTLKDPFDKLWTTAQKLNKLQEKWNEGPMLKLDADEVADEVQSMWKLSYKLTKLFTHPDYKSPLRAAMTIKSRLEKLKISLPFVQLLCNPGLKMRHWDLINKTIGVHITPDAATTLKVMLYHEKVIEKHLEELNEIALLASKEFALEQALKKMKSDWQPMLFNFVAYKSTNLHILASFEDIEALLGDHLVKTATMKNSPLIAIFQKDVNQWDSELHKMKDILESWVKVQSGWMYLESIFVSEDICSQMPNESNLFDQVDEYWREIMKSSILDTRALVVISKPDMLEKLKKSESKLDIIYKGLYEYLEKKRLFFPRFFFLSNDELIEILSETNDPNRVQPHLKKCFEGISKLIMTKTEPVHISAMQSSETEVVEFCQYIIPSLTNGLVEKWLQQVENQMRMSLKFEIEKCMNAFKDEALFMNLVKMFASQVLLACNCLYWTSDVTRSLEDNRLQAYLEYSSGKLDDIVVMVRNEKAKLTRITLEALIVLAVHERDVVMHLLANKITSLNDFHWIGQLRYYLDSLDSESKIQLSVRMITTVVYYAYEYLGNSSRLVITPLTDRCYRTIMGAFQLHLGGSPEGPAGTGKSETTKDLSKAVAKQCCIFNCSGDLDYKAMGKLFKGIAECGAWACFDEFNRIEIDVLSVIAQQIQIIQRAVSENKTRFLFEGVELKLDPSCNIIITMNPGYAGRSELPDNLKVLFRPVAMIIPDYYLIGEVSLYSKGFFNASYLAKKIVQTYKLCSDQLSSQSHYDYGMRAVKSVLTAAGNLKLKHTDEQEELLVLRSIKDVNLPKFISTDRQLFESILQDLFPDVKETSYDYNVFIEALKASLEAMKLEYNDLLLERIIQTYEITKVRHGFMILGDDCTGKTLTYKALAMTLDTLSKSTNMQFEEFKVDMDIINPKAITISELYGMYDPISHEWFDGILAGVFRNQAYCTQDNNRKWLIFDGPVDVLWIENLNTLLDDNRRLCLMSGEIITMSPKQNIIFEPKDVDQASPATISRCGMVYCDSITLNSKLLTKAWLKHNVPKFINKQQYKRIEQLFGWLVEPTLDFVMALASNEKFVNCSKMHLAINFTKFYLTMLNDIEETFLAEQAREAESREFLLKSTKKQATNDNNENIEERNNMIIAHFFFSIVWSIGSVVQKQAADRFDSFLRSLTESEANTRPKDLNIQNNLLFPRSFTVYDYVWVRKQYGGMWLNWNYLIEHQTLSPTTVIKPHELIINTTETVKQNYFMEKIFLKDNHCLFVGPTATGKSIICNTFLTRLMKDRKDETLLVNMTFSDLTTAGQVQDTLMTKLERVRRGVYGAGVGKKAIIYVEDLNMPIKEKYGAQPPLELLRQLADHGFLYNKKEHTRIDFINTTLLCNFTTNDKSSINPKAGIPSRLLRHFILLSINSFDETVLKSILYPLTDWHFQKSGFHTDCKKLGQSFVNSTLKLYNKVCKRFLPTPSKLFYVFNTRDIIRVIHGLLLLNPRVLLPTNSEDNVQANIAKISRLWVLYNNKCFKFSNLLWALR